MAELSQMRANSIAKLRSVGLSPSPQRVAIYEFLQMHPCHPTADLIFRRVRQEIPSISLTTVYNTLKKLVASGLIDELLIEEGELRFDGNINPHGHFKCTSCGEVTDIFPPDSKDLQLGLPALPEGFLLQEIHLCLRGFCSNCSRTAVQES